MAKFESHIAHNSGIPLGGIGTGTVEVRPDGYFHDWQIFNMGSWAPNQPDCCSVKNPDLRPGALSFYVRTQQQDGEPLMRRLGMRTEQNDMYHLTWLKSVQKIDFNGRFPVAELAYHDVALPVQVCSTMVSPLVPHDSRTSGTPGFQIVFRVRNVSDRPVEFSLLGTLENPVAMGCDDRKLANSVDTDGDTTHLTMRTSAASSCVPTIGSMCFSMTGDNPTYIAGEYTPYILGMGQWGSRYGYSHESFIHDFRVNGRLPSLSGRRAPSNLMRMTQQELRALPMREKKKVLAKVLVYPFAHILWKRVVGVDKTIARTEEGISTFLDEIRLRLEEVAGKDRSWQKWGDVALASALTLEPMEEREIVFTVGWHFPHHFSKNGPDMGHMYENWFDDALAVNRFLTAGDGEIRNKACSFADALYSTSLEQEFPDAWAGQLSTINKCTWWTRDGSFAVWEGLGCCGLHTTDITYQGSFNLLALYPDLQKRQMEMGARHQREDGRVHHFFRPDLTEVDESFERVDMNQQFVLLVCRDYLWTGDKSYIRRLWPNIVRAMDCTGLLDADGDGLPDHDTQRNTYDAWNFFGTPSYIASLWLSALMAAARIAEDLGETKHAARWRALLKKGSVNFDKKLWNGEYYSLWVDGNNRDECCMTDQIDGEWFTHIIGLGRALPKERIVAALRAIMKYNYRDEDGLINASYPPREKPTLTTERNWQACAPWTGIEYAIASMMLDFDMVGEARKVVRNIHERYSRAGRFWDHVECGGHYYRAMSSWALLLGATGFKIDVPRESLTIAPAIASDSFHAPWFSSTGWGQLSRTRDAVEVACTSGTISFRHLTVNLEGSKLTATLNDKALRATVKKHDDGRTLSFAKKITLSAGDAFAVGPQKD